MPDKPFFIYFAPGATHAPHHVPKEWADKYKGKFDQGWDKLREETFARQKKLGVIPADCELTAAPRRDSGLGHDHARDEAGAASARWRFTPVFWSTPIITSGGWSMRSKDLEHPGRHADLSDHRRQRRLGRGLAPGLLQRDGSAHGIAAAGDAGVPDGATGQVRRRRGVQPLRGGLGTRHGHALPVDQAGRLALGRHPQRHDRALAQGNQSEGRNPHAVPSRDRRRADHSRCGGSARSRSSSMACSNVRSRASAWLYSFNDAKAAERHETQYFEMAGNRGIYHKGWTAVTRHRTPWLTGHVQLPAFDDDVWELYDTNTDWTQSKDLAKANPEKLHELQRLWLIEAVKYNVLPLDDRFAERANPDIAGRPQLIKGTRQLLFGGMGRLTESSVVNTKNKSHSVTAEVVVPQSGAEGVIVALGGIIGGWSLYAKDGKPKYCYNFFGVHRYTIEGTSKHPAGHAPGADGVRVRRRRPGERRHGHACTSTARRPAKGAWIRPSLSSSPPMRPVTSAMNSGSPVTYDYPARRLRSSAEK